MSFKSVPLYGGAITVEIPTSFGDVSTIREVPDHQEVHLDENGYSNVVFDILEYVEKANDEEALQYHFADLIAGTGDSTNLLNQGTAEFKKVPNKPTYTLNYIQTPPPLSPSKAHRKQSDYTSIHFVMLRLKEQGTDIVITVNVPHYPGEYEKAKEGEGATKLMKDGEVIKEKILETFDIKDWGLFHP
ncbi:Mog1p/PsbP-like protein [Amniculicola lignicola CBS 123094]|uniref:Mog1p/PsbP-like protein n=1 Tax=Amniculicola lignicola CBS 123094 TaxID=1392246 RepID=A0A6A5WFK0_9PLEO|nr:Mog1p/PsbP-like protein [Amniculicola lignicola CBS 123094]